MAPTNAHLAQRLYVLVAGIAATAAGTTLVPDVVVSNYKRQRRADVRGVGVDCGRAVRPLRWSACVAWARACGRRASHCRAGDPRTPWTRA